MLAALRLFQIRLLAKLLELWGRTPSGRAAIPKLRSNRYADMLLLFLVGYRRTFGSFAEAEKYAARFVQNVRKLVESLEAAGYTLRASWPVYERHPWIPLFPELSSTHYSGFYFVRRDPAQGR